MSWQQQMLLPGLSCCSPRVLSLWLASAIWHSLVCFYVPTLALSAESAVNSTGQIVDIWATGTLAYTVVIVVVSQEDMGRLRHLSAPMPMLM